MARRQSGGINKLLNFIGLVDDEPQDTYETEDQGQSYGRRAAYVPVRQQRSNATRVPARQQTAQRRLPETASRSRYDADRYDTRAARDGSRTAGGYDDYRINSARASASRFDDSSRDYAPRAQWQAPASRFAQPSESRYGGNLPQRAQPQRVRVSPRSRTVMYSLHSLEDCCEVIDQLIANNTVVLTMDELDGRLLQRAVDTLSGAVFALHASIRKASDRTYLIAPMSVEVNEAYDVDRRF